MRYTVLFLLALFCFSCTTKPPIAQATVADPSYPFPIKKLVLSDSITIAYNDTGKGKQTILFLHGLGSYSPAWKKNLTELNKHYRCIALDLPGYGHSSKGHYSGSMQFYARVVHDFAQKLKLQKVVLAGHSMGGQIALTTALIYPDVVDKLVLVSPAGFETFTEAQRQWFQQVMTPEAVQRSTEEQIRANIANNFYQMPTDAQFMIDDRLSMRTAADFPDYCFIIPQCVKGMLNGPVFDRLDQVKQPTLVLFGQQDKLIPNRYLNKGSTEDYARQGAAKIPNCRLVMVPEAGHFLMFERAELFDREVVGFLK